MNEPTTMTNIVTTNIVTTNIVTTNAPTAATNLVAPSATGVVTNEPTTMTNFVATMATGVVLVGTVATGDNHTLIGRPPPDNLSRRTLSFPQRLRKDTLSTPGSTHLLKLHLPIMSMRRDVKKHHLWQLFLGAGTLVVLDPKELRLSRCQLLLNPWGLMRQFTKELPSFRCPLLPAEQLLRNHKWKRRPYPSP